MYKLAAMCTHDSRCQHVSPDDTLARVRLAIEENKEECGWFDAGIFGTELSPPFNYTIGLTRNWQQPEIVIAGLDVRVAHQVLSAVADEVRGGMRFWDGSEAKGLIEGFRVRFRAVNYADCKAKFYIAHHYYGADVPFLQLVYPDSQGRFPGQPGCEPVVATVQDLTSEAFSPGADSDPFS